MDLPAPAFKPTPHEWLARIAEHLGEGPSGSQLEEAITVVRDEASR